MSLLQSALADVGYSLENFQDIPDEVVSVDQPSVNIPLTEEVTELVETPPDVVMVPGVPIEALSETTEPCIDNAIAEHALLQDKADELVALQSAMERYESIIRKTGYGGITPQTAEVIQVAIIEAQAKLGINTKIGSMESFKANGPREQHELATVSIESIRETAKAAGSSFIAAIERIIEYIKRLGQNLFDGVIQVDHALAKLDQQLGATKSTGGGTQVQINTTMLEDGDALVVGAPPKILMLASFTVVDYPARVAKFFDDAAKVVSSVSKDDDDLTEVFERLDAATKPLADVIESKVDSDILPGGYELDVSEGGLSFGLKDGNAGAKDMTIDSATTRELRDQVRQLKALVETLKKIRPNAEKISSSGKTLLSAAKKVGNDQVLSKAATFIQQANPRVGEVISYLVKYIKAQCVAIKTQAEANAAGKTKPSAGNGKTAGGDDDLPDNPGFKNLRKFVENGELITIRTALRLMFNDTELSSDDIVDAKRWTMTKVDGLFDPFVIKAFARDIDLNKSAWTEDYYGDQIVYLKTNYAEKRFDHIVKVREYLMERGEF